VEASIVAPDGFRGVQVLIILIKNLPAAHGALQGAQQLRPSHLRRGPPPEERQDTHQPGPGLPGLPQACPPLRNAHAGGVRKKVQSEVAATFWTPCHSILWLHRPWLSVLLPSAAVPDLVRHPSAAPCYCWPLHVQNDLEEFYAMVSFTNPGALGDGARFRRYFPGMHPFLSTEL